MTTYYRLDTLSKVDLTPEQFAALQANGKAAALLRLWVPTVPPVPTAQQVLVEGTPTIDATNATQTWSVRAKTQAELDADNVSANRTQIKAALAIFDAGTATSAQIQKAIAWLIRQTQ